MKINGKKILFYSLFIILLISMMSVVSAASNNDSQEITRTFQESTLATTQDTHISNYTEAKIENNNQITKNNNKIKKMNSDFTNKNVTFHPMNNCSYLKNAYTIGELRYKHDENNYYSIIDTTFNLTVNNETHPIITTDWGYVNVNDSVFNKENPIFTTLGNNTITISFINETSEYSYSTVFTTMQAYHKYNIINNGSYLNDSYNIGHIEYKNEFFKEYLKNIPINLTVNMEKREINITDSARIIINNSIFSNENPIFTTLGNNNITIELNNTQYGQFTENIIFTTMNSTIKYFMSNNGTYLNNSYNIGSLRFGNDIKNYTNIEHTMINLSINGETNQIYITKGDVIISNSAFSSMNPIFTTEGNNNITIEVNSTEYGQYNITTTFTTQQGSITHVSYSYQFLKESYAIGMIYYENLKYHEYINCIPINLIVNGEEHTITTTEYGIINVNKSVFAENNPIFTTIGDNNITISINHEKYGTKIINSIFRTEDGYLKFEIYNNGSSLSNEYDIGILKYSSMHSYFGINDAEINVTINEESKIITTDRNGHININDTIFNPENPIFTTLGNNNITIQLNNTQYGQYTKNTIFTTKNFEIDCQLYENLLLNNQYDLGYLKYGNNIYGYYRYDKSIFINLTVNDESHIIKTEDNGDIIINNINFNENNPIFTTPDKNNITLSFNDENYGEYNTSYNLTTYEKRIRFDSYEVTTFLKSSYNIGNLKYGDEYEGYNSLEKNIPLNITVNGETQTIQTHIFGEIHINNTIFNPENPIFTTLGENNITIQLNNTLYGQYTHTTTVTTKEASISYYMLDNGTSLSPVYYIGTLFYGNEYYRQGLKASIINLTVNGETHPIILKYGSININNTIFSPDNPIFTTLGNNNIIISMENETDYYYNETVFTTLKHYLKLEPNNKPSYLKKEYEIGYLKYTNHITDDEYLDLWSNETIIINLTVNGESKTIYYTASSQLYINKSTFSEDNPIFTTPGENNITMIINDEKYGELNYSYIFPTIGFTIKTNPLDYDNSTKTMTISGRIYNQEDQPEENLDLTIFINDKKVYTSTDNNGNYQYKTQINETNPYKIVISINGNYTQKTQIWNFGSNLEDNKTPVQININNYTEKIYYKNNIKITGNITDKNGNPVIIPYICYKIIDLNYEKNVDIGHIECDELGMFDYDRPVDNYYYNREYYAIPGTYEFTLSLPPEFEEYSCNNISRTFIVEGKNLTNIETKININPIETIKNGDDLYITGSVTDENNNPVGNIWLEFILNNNAEHPDSFLPYHMTMTKSNGEFRLYLTYEDYQAGTNIVNTSIIDYTIDKKEYITTFEVKRNIIKIQIDDIPKFINNPKKINITGTVTDENDNLVEEYIAIYIYDTVNPDYFYFSKNGKINLSYDPLWEGYNKVIITNAYSYQESNTITKEFYINFPDLPEATLNHSIDINNETKTIKIYGNVLKNNNEPLNENIVKIKINDYQTNITTNNEGYYELNYIPNNNNIYNVTISLLNESYYCLEIQDSFTINWYEEENENNLTEIIKQQNKTINELNELINQLNEIIRNLNENTTNLQEIIIEQNNTIETQNETLNNLTYQNNQLNNTNQELIQNNTQQQHTITQLNNTINRQNNTITELNNKNEDLNNKLTEQKNINTQLNNIIREYDNTITTLEEENLQNMATISQLNTDKTNLENQLQELEQENTQLSKNNNELYNDKIQLRNQINNLTKQSLEKDNTITNLQNQNKQQNTTINNLKEQIKTSNNTINTLNTTNNELTNTINNLTKQNNNYANTIKDLNKTNKNLTTSKQQLENQITKLTTENKNQNNTIKQLNNTNKQLLNQITQLNNTIKNLNKTTTKNATTITVYKITGRVGSTIKLKAKVIDNNNKAVTEGKVVFKVNGISLKDSDGNVIYAPITNGIATINYVIPRSWMKNTTTLEAVYSETEHYQSSRRTITGHNITPGNVKLKIADLPVHENGDKTQFVITATDEKGNTINGGTVILKANGITLKDSKGKDLTATVQNGVAIIDYNITLGARIHDITAVYAYTGYNRIEAKNKLTVTKGEIFIRCDPVTTKTNTTTITASIVDKTKNKIPYEVDVGVKVNGATVAKTTAINGTISFTIPTKYAKGTYTMVFTSGETGAYKSDRLTTVLIKQ